MSIEFLTYWSATIFYIGVILYVCLDGFGLGLGCLHIFGRNDKERRLFLNAVGPVWDGNAVWIIITTGVLLAAFTKVFTSLLSGFYLPMMVLIFGFMVRSAAIEFRSKRESILWRNCWDYVFWIASLAMAIDFGMILGHTIQGIPIQENGVIAPHSFRFFSFYPIAVGLFSTALFMVHGGIYILNKIDGALQRYLRRIILSIYPILILFWISVTLYTLLFEIHMLEIFRDSPIFFILVLISIACFIFLPRLIRTNSDLSGFFLSCILLFSLVSIYAIGMYPVFAYSSIDRAFSLTIENSANSYRSLLVVFIVSLCGLPLSFFYFSYIYKVFRGPVSIDSTSY